MQNSKSPKLVVLLAGYLIVLTYGTLYPLSNWRIPSANVFLLLQPDYSLADIATNFIIYVPAGALLMTVLRGRSLIARVAVVAVLLGGMSLLLEMIQALLPARVSSVADASLNATGATTGALLAPFLLRLLAIGGRFQQLRRAYLRDDPVARAAAVALLLWLAAQWSPFVPYIDPYAMWGATEPLREALHGAELNPQTITEHALELTALGLLLNFALRDPYTSALWLVGLLGLGIAGNVSIVTQQIYPERLIGTATAIALTVLLQGPKSRARAVTGIVLLCMGVLAGELWPPFSHSAGTFNWMPLQGQLHHPLLGIRDLLDGVWPFCAVAAFSAGAMHGPPGWLSFTVGGLLIVAYTGLVEWGQLWQPHRYPDVTDVMMACSGWTIGHFAARRSRIAVPASQAAKPRRPLARTQRDQRPDEKSSVPAPDVNETI